MDKAEVKTRVVKSKSLAGALVWMGFAYKKDSDNNFVFERSSKFDWVWKDLHAMRNYHDERLKK